MQTKKPGGENEWVDPDEAPLLAREWFERADVHRANQTAGHSKPEPVSSKEAVSLRLDADILAFFRATGPDWQSRVNEALRKAAGL
jgi:uncharacterized protein (DUF4415 family)